MSERVPPMHPVESSMVSAVGYDAAAEALYARYATGGLYVYEGVPAAVWQGLGQAKSVGTYLRGVVFGKYRYRRVGDVEK